MPNIRNEKNDNYSESCVVKNNKDCSMTRFNNHTSGG